MTNPIRTARLAAGLTQQQLAERCGCVRSMIAQLESGDRTPSVELLRALRRELRLCDADVVHLVETSGRCAPDDDLDPPTAGRARRAA